MVRVIFPNLELYLTGRFRWEVKARGEPVCSGVQVGNKEPDLDNSFPAKLIVVHDFVGTDTSVVTSEHDVGISVLCETEEDCITLAAIVHAIARDVADNLPGNPVAAVVGSTSPAWVPEQQQRFRMYFTVTYAVAGKPL